MIFTQILLRWYGGTGVVMVTGFKDGVVVFPSGGAGVTPGYQGPYPADIEITAPGFEFDIDHAVIDTTDITAAGNQVVFLKPDGTEVTVDLASGTDTYDVDFKTNVGGLIVWGGLAVALLGGLYLVTRK